MDQKNNSTPDFSKEGQVNQTPKTDGITSMDELKKGFASDLLDPLNTNIAQVASIAHEILKDEFGKLCTIKMKQTPNGFFKICMTKNGIQEKSVSQIEITVTKDGKFNVHLNDYDHHDEYYFYGEKLTSKDLTHEVRSFQAFLNGQTMSEDTKLQKIAYFNPEDY